MNPIKFRVWDIQRQEFLKDNGDFTYESLGKTYQFRDVATRPDRFIMQQFTGLIDKNMNEIYVGDVVKSFDELEFKYSKEIKPLEGEVTFHHSYFAVGKTKMFVLDDGALEIIGTIFD